MTAEVLDQQHQLTPSGTGLGEEADQAAYNHLHGQVTVHGAVSNWTLSVSSRELVSPAIVDYVSGLLAFKKTMRGIRDQTAAQGMAAVSSSPIRGSNRTRREDLLDPTGLHVDTHEAIFDAIAADPRIQDLPNGDKLSFSKVNFGAHSYGAEIAVKYALQHPDDVANIVFLKPVGMEEPGIARFIPRLPVFYRKEMLPQLRHLGPNFSIWDIKRSVAHTLADPYQTVGETVACVLSDNRRHLPTLVERGIGTAILTGDKDNLIPAEPIEAHAAHLVDHYERLPTDHLGPQNEPALVSAAVIRSILTLEHLKTFGINLSGDPFLTLVKN